MISVSSAFKQAMTQPIKELDAYINTDTEQIKSADDLISIKVSGETSMCKTAMRKLEAKIIGDHDLVGKWVNVGFGVRLEDRSFEYLDYGSFLITEISESKDTGVTQVVGYDKMINTMVEYTPLEVTYPIGLYNYTVALCRVCGLDVSNKLFGKNMFIENMLNTYKDEDDGESYIFNNNRFYRVNLLPNITFEENTQYTIQYTAKQVGTGNPRIMIHYTDGTTDNVGGTNNNGKIATTLTYYERTSRVNKTISYIDVGYGANAENGFYIKKNSLQIEKGTTATPYEPYNTMNDWQITEDLYKNINGITYRDILVQIAQATGSTCIIDTDNNVCFKYITPTGESLTYDNMFKYKNEPIYGEINKVILGRDPVIGEDVFMQDSTSIENNGLTEFRIDNNEIVDKQRELAITPIYNVLHGIYYYPFETTTEGLGWYEIGDSFNIVDDLNVARKCVLFNFSITIDGGIKEILKAVAETKTQSQYQYANPISKRVKNTEIIVNKQEGYIDQLVSDMYEEDGIVHENFTQVYQDIQNIINSVQNSGGANLLKNSVMFAYDNSGTPNDWDLSGSGTLSIQSSAESLINGCLSGNVFILNNKTVKQRVYVKANSDENNKTYYSFSTRIKKGAVGTCYVKIYNDNEEYRIDVSAGESVFYKEYELVALLPTSTYYDIEFYGSADSDATFTDNMFAIGEYKTQWQQASGEIMNTQVNINVDGVLVKSSVYAGNYTVMSPLEFAGYSNKNGTITKVFTLNDDTTEVDKLKATNGITMPPIKIVPVNSGSLKGWAFVPSTEV